MVQLVVLLVMAMILCSIFQIYICLCHVVSLIAVSGVDTEDALGDVVVEAGDCL